MANETAYCLKCQQKHQLSNSNITTTKTGKKILKGICSVCGTKCNKFLKQN